MEPVQIILTILFAVAALLAFLVLIGEGMK